MRRWYLLALVAAALTGPASNQARAVEAGETAPAFSIESSAGGKLSLEDYRGKIVYLDFWASWCVPCRVSLPWMAEIQKKYGAQGVQVIAVNVDKKRSDAERFADPLNGGLSIGYDPAGSVPALYQIKGMPTSYLIGQNGEVLSVHSGFKDSTAAEVEQEIVAKIGELK